MNFPIRKKKHNKIKTMKFNLNPKNFGTPKITYRLSKLNAKIIHQLSIIIIGFHAFLSFGREKFIRTRLTTKQYTNVMIIKGINHGDESSCLNSDLNGHFRNVSYNHSMEGLGYSQIIYGAQWL